MGLVLTLLSLLHVSTNLTLPVFTAYPDPNPDGASISEKGALEGWKSTRTKIEWGGYLASPGSLSLKVKIGLPSGVHATYRLITASANREQAVIGTGQESVIDFGSINISKAQWRTIFLQGVRTTGKDFGNLKSLNLSGDSVQGAKFNLKERRNAASVHLGFPVAKGDKPDWFYNEIIGLKDPLDTYYEACGFSRGYFGMQVNGPHDRRVIFSVWDSGKEAVDRKKVNKVDLVQLLAKGKNVFAAGFGNEGTGGHSHLEYKWQTGSVQRFLVHAEPKGQHTIYTAYFFDPEKGHWRLIASFDAPHDGTYLHGLYSFVEDFNGDNGNLLRKAQYGPAWIHTQTGGWKLLSTARFTHDGTGGKDRFDYDFGVENGRFFLQNGAFQGKSPKFGSLAHLPPQPIQPPDIDLHALAKNVTD